REAYQPLKTPFTAPNLPKEFVNRPAAVKAIVGKMLDAKRESPLAATTALVGIGGIGKTTLAMALCHDQEIKEAFLDGILYITVGQTPDLLTLITNQIQELTSTTNSF